MPTSDEYITINSVVLALEGAWELVDPTPMLGEGPARGANRVVPGTAGTVFRSKVRGEFREVLELDVFGEKNQAGTPFANYRVGMKTNIEYLRTNLLVANVGAVTMSYRFPDASTRTGSCEVLSITPSSRSQTGNWTVCALEVVVPFGKLV
jgi:hypothetical protein